MTLNVHRVFHVEWLAVEMSRTFFLAVDYSRGGAECVYERVGIDIACKQVYAYHCLVKRCAGVYYGNVEQSVGKAGMGSYVSVVAVLRRVAAGYQKRLFGKDLAVGAHCIYLRVVLDIFRDGTFQIGQFPSFTLPREIAADGSVKTYSEGAEKMSAVNRPVIAFQQIVFGYYVDGKLRVERYSEMTCQPVA